MCCGDRECVLWVAMLLPKIEKVCILSGMNGSEFVSENRTRLTCLVKVLISVFREDFLGRYCFFELIPTLEVYTTSIFKFIHYRCVDILFTLI
jgi:hypothetical protein